jgi:ADP-ribosylglycohydrolase
MSGWWTVAAAHEISYIYQDDPKRAIAAAAASGGDTDTVASIAGGIVGARNGVDVFEGEWMTGLSARSAVEAAIGRLTT